MLSTSRAGPAVFGVLARASPTQARVATPSRWVRYASSHRYPGRPRGRILRFLAVFGVSAAAVSLYPLVLGAKEESRPVQVPQAEVVFEKARKAGASPEERRDILSSQHLQVKKSWENPGVYAWGLNTGKVAAPDSKETYIKAPRRLRYFDGQLLRDLKLDREVGAAITEGGDLVQWGTAVSAADPAPVVTLQGKNLVKLALSRDRILALASSGNVFSLPVSKPASEPTAPGQAGTSAWIPFWSAPTSPNAILSLKPSGLGWGEKVIDISGGQEHCLMLTSKGRVFSAASSAESFPSLGQLGVPGLTWDNRPPGLYCQPHEVHGPDERVVGIATGDFHSLLLDSAGGVYAFGSNSAGQLGIPTETTAPFVDKATRLQVEKLYRGSGLIPRVTSVAAGGLNSFFTVDTTASLNEEAPRALASVGQTAAEVWACGEGIYGTLGTGRWAHGYPSSEPTKIKSLSNLYEFDDAANRTVPIRLAGLSVGSSHVSVIMKNITNVSASDRLGNDTNWGADVLFWGRNESYQLGTGKRNNENVPVYIGPLDGGKGDVEKGRKGEAHRLQVTPRKTVHLEVDGKSRKVSVEQRVECGRDISAVYSST
ncbi:RCC1/BLIP-II [Thozetella sp. PMI_491]|nr:RCC1/BLIP-II [Thozetella sp. PMI_491]